jgi:molecular chaperone DnaJ
VIADPCGDCGGVGLRREEATVAIEIPAGVDHGMQLRMHGEGDLGDLQLPRGDLLLLFQTQDPPDGWERDGNDLHRLLPLQLVDAVLGRKMTIPGIGDELQVSVPAGSRDGDTITIRGAGLPDVNGGRRGRIILHAALEVPRKLNRKQRKIWEQLRDG